MPKATPITINCRKLLDALPPGARLPSVRQLMRRYKVSQLVISQALAELKSSGLISTQVGRGTFKSFAPPSDKPLVALLLPNWQSSFTAAVLQEFTKLFEARGYQLKPYYHEYNIDGIRPELFPPGIAALIIYWHWNLELQRLSCLSQLKIPVVLIDTAPQGIALNAVCTDNDLGGALAAAHFLAAGRRQIAILLAQPHLVSSTNRVNGFVKYLNLNRIQPEIIDCATRSGESSIANAYQRIMDLHAAGQLNFSALFCDSDLGALGVLRACHVLHIAVPDQLSIIGFDNISECGYLRPSLTSIDQRLDAWAAASEEIITANRQAPMPPQQILIRPELVERESTTPSDFFLSHTGNLQTITGDGR